MKYEYANQLTGGIVSTNIVSLIVFLYHLMYFGL